MIVSITVIVVLTAKTILTFVMPVQTNATTSDASLCSRADELKQADVPLQLVSGWFDSTAAAAINLYHYCGQAPGLSSLLFPVPCSLPAVFLCNWVQG